MYDLDIQRPTTSAGERAERTYLQLYLFIYLFHNTEIISIDWGSEGDDTFSFQASVITLSM